MVKNTEMNRTELAKAIIDDLDLDDLMAYATDRMVEYFETLDDELFDNEWKNHFDL